MKITTKQFRAVLLTNILALGLVACSSTPAPWSRPDTSPWSDKRSAEAGAAPADDIVTQVPVFEPEPVPEPEIYEPVVEPTPVEVPAPTAYQAQSVVSDINNEQRILSLPGEFYAVQAYAAATLDSVEKFKSDNSLDNMMAVETDRDGKSIYVLVETHETRNEAQAAAAQVQSATGTKPWVRSVAGLQKIIKQ